MYVATSPWYLPLGLRAGAYIAASGGLCFRRNGLMAAIDIDDELCLATEQLALALSSVDDLQGHLQTLVGSDDWPTFSTETYGRVAFFVRDCEMVAQELGDKARSLITNAQTLYEGDAVRKRAELTRARSLLLDWHRDAVAAAEVE